MYSQLYQNKTQIKTSTRKIRIFYAPRFFSGQNRKKKCANYASKYGMKFDDSIGIIRGVTEEDLVIDGRSIFEQILKKWVWRAWTGQRQMVGCVECFSEPLGSIKCGNLGPSQGQLASQGFRLMGLVIRLVSQQSDANKRMCRRTQLYNVVL